KRVTQACKLRCSRHKVGENRQIDSPGWVGHLENTPFMDGNDLCILACLIFNHRKSGWTTFLSLVPTEGDP
ncbi:hypothetical protein, partial [Marinobacter sp. SS8-8]|uniref:hypothetical protein n=1 Tax=Marinobacter sp. SS8-8 TaxID=3050452 RepID=UPI0026E0A2DF